MSKFKAGDKVKVIGNCNGHGINIGEVITIKRKDNSFHSINVYEVLESLYIMREGDLELIPKKDSIVKEVRKDLKQRSKVGIEKYACTLDRKDLSLLEWHQHHYEELLDAALYTKRIIQELKTKQDGGN